VVTCTPFSRARSRSSARIAGIHCGVRNLGRTGGQLGFDGRGTPDRSRRGDFRQRRGFFEYCDENRGARTGVEPEEVAFSPPSTRRRLSAGLAVSAGRFAGGAIAMGDGTQLGRGVIVARNRCSRKVVVVLTLDKIFFLKDTKFTAPAVRGAPPR
jgi:hypothetical protein